MPSRSTCVVSDMHFESRNTNPRVGPKSWLAGSDSRCMYSPRGVLRQGRQEMQHTIEITRIGQAIAAERAAKGLKAYTVAALANIDPSRLRDIERGRTEPSRELAERILKVIANA